MFACIMGAAAQHLTVVVSTVALLVTLIGSSTALPTSSNIIKSTAFLPDDDYIRPDDRLHRRDFTWRTTHRAPSNLCGNSTFKSTYHAMGFVLNYPIEGPSVWDCQTFVNSSKAMNGTWLVNDFGSKGENWVEFSRVQSCKVAVRHSDGGNGTIP